MSLRKLILLVGLLLASAPSWAEDSEVRIGVLAFRGEKTAIEMWKPTADYLSRSIPGHQFNIVPLNLNTIRGAVDLGRVDFILTNTGNYVDLEHRYGITRIATLKNRRQGKPYTQFGAVIFTRADREEIQQLEDLKGRRFMAVSKEAFGGFQMAWLELTKHGIDPFKDLSLLRFAGFPQDRIVYAVKNGEVDAGTVRTDTMERMAFEGKINLESFRVLNSQETPGFPFRHSTPLYPEWPFAKLKGTGDALAEQVAVALLTLPAGSEVARAARSEGWTIPLDYSPVHSLFRSLRIGPYSDLGKISLSKLIEQYGHWILMAMIALLVMGVVTFYMLRINRRIGLSQQELRSEIVERRKIEEQLQRHQETLEQRVSERTGELQRLNRELQEDIVARRRAENTLRESDATLRALHDVTSSQELEFDDKIRALLEIGCRHFGLDVGVLVKSEDGYCLITQVCGPEDYLAKGAKIPVGETFCSITLNSKLPLQIPNAAKSQWAQHPACRDHGRLAYFGTTVLAGEHPYGTLNFTSTVARELPFTLVDTDILQLMAQWIGGEIERQRTQQESEQHQSELAHVTRLSTMGEMASGLAHELNQPLTAIVNYSRGCERRLKNQSGQPDLVRALRQVSAEAERAAEIIRRLRELVRKGKPHHIRADVNEAVSVVAQITNAQFKQNQVELRLQLARNLPEVKADLVQIEQVMLNLVRNAIDSMTGDSSRPRVLTICTELVSAEFVQVRVSDTGRGVSQAMSEQVFEPFFTTKSEGMGMGLSISRTIIDAHGGQLGVASAGTEGASFQFTLPIYEAIVAHAQ